MSENDSQLNIILNEEVPMDAPEFLVFSERTSPRLEYTLSFIFTRFLACRYLLCNSYSEAQDFQGPVLNYSKLDLPGSFRIQPVSLLFETGIKESKPELKIESGLPRAYHNNILPTPEELSYDLMAMVFYFISRYEEWQDFKADEHGRFGVGESILYRYKWHLRPVIDLCLVEFRDKLMDRFKSIRFSQKPPNLISTLDVDNLFAYAHKGVIRTCAASLRDLLKGDFANIGRRWRVINREQKDPFDVYEELSIYCSNLKIPIAFFFLLRSGTAYDRTVNAGSRAFKNVIENLKKQPVDIGIHPSYYSSTDPGRLQKETELMKKKFALSAHISRQHYLRFNIRSTPEVLLRSGIMADFSMGYSNAPGFRAGTSFPFYYYDFKLEAQGNLLFVPFCFMDGAYSIHNKLKKEEILDVLDKVAEDICSTGGNFISVFHERSFDDHLYPGFGSLYREIHLRLKEKLGNKN